MTPEPARRVAVVDVGSNSVRLFLCSGLGPDGPTGERWTTITGLKRGAGPDGRIAQDALVRLDACLAEYAPRVRAFGAPVLALGTAAVREAPNRDEVDAVVRRRLAAPLRVVAGEEEAALAFRGARLALDDDEPALVVDVGGGSTELVRGGPDGPDAAVSLPLGSVRCTERHLHGDPPDPGELDAQRRAAGALIRPALAGWPPAPVVGVAGTFTTLAAIRLGGYDPVRVHRLRMSRDEIESIAAELAAMPLAERRGVPGLQPERAPVIVGGAVIAACVLEAAGAGAVLVSERDLLDGAALDAERLLASISA